MALKHPELYLHLNTLSLFIGTYIPELSPLLNYPMLVSLSTYNSLTIWPPPRPPTPSCALSYVDSRESAGGGDPTWGEEELMVRDVREEDGKMKGS